MCSCQWSFINSFCTSVDIRCQNWNSRIHIIVVLSFRYQPQRLNPNSSSIGAKGFYKRSVWSSRTQYSSSIAASIELHASSKPFCIYSKNDLRVPARLVFFFWDAWEEIWNCSLFYQRWVFKVQIVRRIKLEQQLQAHIVWNQRTLLKKGSQLNKEKRFSHCFPRSMNRWS